MQDQPHDEARREARDERDRKKTPLGGSRLLALAQQGSEQRKRPFEGWTLETPSEWLGYIEARVRSIRHYADSDVAKNLLIWGALVDLHLLIDQMEVHMLWKNVPSEWREPVVQVETRRRTIAT